MRLRDLTSGNQLTCCVVFRHPATNNANNFNNVNLGRTNVIPFTSGCIDGRLVGREGIDDA